MYSNYLLSPNFEGTNVSALGREEGAGGKKREKEKVVILLFILRVFGAVHFFMNEWVWGRFKDR